MVTPPPDASQPTAAGRAAPTPATTDRPPAAPQSPVIADRANIRPLDLAGALQILLSEVQAELDQLLLAEDASAPSATPPRFVSLESASGALADKILAATPEATVDIPSWSAAVTRIDTAWQSGAARALELVSSWRDVPQTVTDGVRQSIANAATLLNEEAVNPWLRAEWTGLAPRLERYRRRRRNLRRYLSDPDFRPRDLDEDDERR